jgi:large subunit ribosomal protein L13
MKTMTVKSADIKRETHTIDASEQMLGRLATQVAILLMGKHKTTFSRAMDIGDIVIVVNAEKIKVSGKKPLQKMYYRHSGYPGGFRKDTFEKMMEIHPDRVIEYAVKGMLPTNRLRARMLKRLRIYPGELPVPVKTEPVPAAE